MPDPAQGHGPPDGDNGFRAIVTLVAALRSELGPTARLMFDFAVGQRDAPFQVIPQGWVEAAMNRWHAAGGAAPMTALGVDIAQLNLVNLRNVPPTPANYAQRSGRAGRSGQPAQAALPNPQVSQVRQPAGPTQSRSYMS